ncbi:MAG: hypothetical protein J5I93_11800 [Pirellulaceae bacterium]|nr:hypothetical protein [Pirellulaceae bacterium]
MSQPDANPYAVTALLVPSSELGEVVFERRAGWGRCAALAVCSAIGIALGTLMTWAVVSQPVFYPELGQYAGLFLLGGMGLGYAAVSAVFGRFRCHREGISKQGLLGEKALRYEHIAEFSYIESVPRRGVSRDRSVTLSFSPPRGIHLRGLYVDGLRSDDPELVALRDHIARLLGEKMQQRLEQGGEVPWTSRLTLTPHGLRYRKNMEQAFWLYKPYAEIGAVEFSSGQLLLRERPGAEPLVREFTVVSNFYPGLEVFKRKLPRA